METERAVERLIFFTDAVAAIAITLLILPLVEIVTADANKANPVPVTAFFTDNISQLFAFVLSFVIIARFWMANHEILADVVRATSFFMWLDIMWVFTIVVLPLPTEISAVYKASEFTVLIYITTCLASTALLTAMSVYLYRHPELERKGKATSGAQIWGIGSTTVAFVIALAVDLIFPKLNYYSLLALFITFPLDAIIKPRIKRHEAARTPN